MLFRKVFVAISLAVLLIPAGAVAGMAYNLNGYAPNSSSPVVGGWAEAQGRCTSWVFHRIRSFRYRRHSSYYCGSYNTNFRPFGDVVLSGAGWGRGGTWTGSIACPDNTAVIQTQNYRADNGVVYNSVFNGRSWRHAISTAVCVNTDTGKGGYGGQ